jgi:histone deacetylase complex regulatory component SIN3
VDNWAVGGLAIGIDVENESLHKYGFYKPGYGTKALEHPNSGIVFDGYKIPFLQQAIEQAKNLHSFLPGVHSIGWDIAIGENGPIIIEGNDNWEISLVQICSHGLQKEFDNYFN